MNPYSLLFEPIYKEKVWGGRALERLGKALPAGKNIGESWELADLPESVPDGRSVIANGPLAGKTIHEALADHRDTVLGAARPAMDGAFPLLIKYLDARENLSVQVHPDEAYVEAHPEAHLKSEAWYVIDAEPGAVIYRGIDPSVTRAQFAEHLTTDKVVDDLLAIPVQAGQCHYLPSGTCHALGAGIVVAEIQTPSDTTFRVYDWGRTDRELHVAQALECIHFGPGPANRPAGADAGEGMGRNQPIEVEGVRTEPLISTDFFEIERVVVLKAGRLEIVTNGQPIIWMLLDGSGRVTAPGAGDTPLRRGDTVLHPAALEGAGAEFAGSATLLAIAPPSPLRGKLA